MKKTSLLILALLPVVTNAATTSYFTNVNSTYTEIYSSDFSYYLTLHSPGEVLAYTFNTPINPMDNTWNVNYIEPSDGSYNSFYITIPTNVDSIAYSFNLPDMQAYGSPATPISVPEPSTGAFFAGFALVFMAGLSATGARWVRQLIVGETETL